jgi:dipeptidyl aminopeptidase/acylaminoacyl peptidase
LNLRRTSAEPTSNLWLLAALLLFSGWSVYTRYFDLGSFDLVTRMPFRDLSMMQYDETLAGTRTFPYQWRVLAFWIAGAGNAITGLDPHLIDAAVKTLSLAASAAILYVFATSIVSGVGAVLAAVLYLFVTAAAFASEGYAIYFTNDYLAVLSWFAGALAIQRRWWWVAALAAFAGGWAKETPLLIFLLVSFEALRKRAPWSAVIMIGIAFVIPNVVLRTMYPAPISQWAWWDTFRLNVPFLTLEGPAIVKSLRDNLKVILFLNVMWFWAWRAWRRKQDPFLTSLALTLACYVVLAWMVVYIRELRHMLPFTFFVIPLAVAELETLMRHRSLVIAALVLASSSLVAQAQPAAPSGYLLPPKEVVDILDAPPPPTVEVSPSRDVVVVIDRASMPTIADLAQPMHRVAGLRINPRTNGPHRAQLARAITLKVIADGSERKVTLPQNPKLSWIGFSPDGKRFAFTQQRDNGIELWIGESATGQAKALTTAQLNAVNGTPCEWVADGGSMLCEFVAPNRGAAPSMGVPTGPNIQEHRGGTAPVRTYQDLLTSAYDESLFDYYATSQLAFVDAAGGQRTPVGAPAIFATVSPSPDGQFVLVRKVRRPYSWLVPYSNFPASIEVWDRTGATVKQIAQLPVADNVPNGGVLPGPRSFQWQPLAPATVVWAEALDNGDPKAKVPQRDKVMTMSAPFSGEPTELARTEYRYGGVSWTDNGAALLTENDRTRRWTRTWVIDRPGAAPRKVWDRSQEDSYSNPGTPQRRERASGHSTIRQNGSSIYVAGAGASPEGARPFIDRLDLTTLKTERMFQTTGRSYETVLDVLADDGSLILTRYETRNDPPNVYVRDLKSGARRAITSYTDPAPQLKGIQKQLVTYKRNDGVELSATIITPPGWTPAQGPLPTLLWAYPREFTDPNNAGQVTGSADRYTAISGASHLLFLTQGYAIIDDPTMPIVGPGETANDTYVQQLVASAQAAVDRAVELGVTDRNRVVAGGHSYGGFMTANLLAHSDIFRAGLARSGAYNRTLTPFGFQNEQRTFWEVPHIYSAMSPFNFAHKVNEPILLIHGEADDNSGTFPIQSERFYMALKGHGAIVRYVTLPHEAHGYAARESVLHAVAEMLNWANEWGKNAKPRQPSTSSQQQ